MLYTHVKNMLKTFEYQMLKHLLLLMVFTKIELTKAEHWQLEDNIESPKCCHAVGLCDPQSINSFKKDRHHTLHVENLMKVNRIKTILRQLFSQEKMKKRIFNV